MFSGTDIQDACSRTIAELLGCPGALDTIAACECVASKQAFIHHVIDQSCGAKCIFNKVGDLTEDLAPCSVHGKRCNVPQTAPYCCRWLSCGSLSKANKAHQQGAHAQCLRQGTGTSGSTFQDGLDFLEVHTEVRCFIGENVDDVLRLTSDNRAAIMDLFTEGGGGCASSK